MWCATAKAIIFKPIFQRITFEKHRIIFKTLQSIRLTLWCHLSWEMLYVLGAYSFVSHFSSIYRMKKRMEKTLHNNKTTEQYLKMAFRMWFIDSMAERFNGWLLCTHANFLLNSTCLSCSTAGQSTLSFRSMGKVGNGLHLRQSSSSSSYTHTQIHSNVWPFFSFSIFFHWETKEMCLTCETKKRKKWYPPSCH